MNAQNGTFSRGTIWKCEASVGRREIGYAEIGVDTFGNAIGDGIVAAQTPQYGLTKTQQQQEYSDINTSTSAAVAADGQQISNQIATAVGGAANAGDAPLTNNEEPTLPEVVVSAPPVPAGADTALDIYANLVQRSPTTGKPTYAQPLAVEALGDTASLYYELRQQGIVPSAGLQGMVADEVTNATGNSGAGNAALAALQQEAASDQAAIQGQETNFSTTDVANENAAEIFKTFGPYPVVAGAWNLGAKAVSGLAGLATLAFTGDANEATSAINRVQSSLQLDLSSRLTTAIGQTASPYVNAEQAFLDNHFGVGTETVVNSGIEFGADTLGILGGGSALRELAPELNAAYSLRSPFVPVGAGEMGVFGIKAIQSPFVSLDSGLPVVTFSASKYPGLADNILNAQQAGYPDVLTYGGDAAANRAAALEGVPNIPPLSRDEYPFASTLEGGGSSWVGHIPVSEQNAQGAILKNFYKANNIQPGDQFRVIVGR